MEQIQNKFGLSIVGALLLTIVAALAGGVFAGPLDPPAPPGSTQQTQITSLPFTISASGSYILTGNLSGATGITITADNVTLDLEGFSLTGTGSSSVVAVSGSHSNITLRNGSVIGIATGVGVAAVDFASAKDSHITNLTASAGDSASLSPNMVVNLGANTTLSNCELIGGPGGITDGVKMSGTGSVVSGCNSRQTYQGIDDVAGKQLITGNTLTGLIGGPGITVKGGSSVSGNTLSGFASGGISADATSGGVSITHNTVTSTNTGYGISVSSGSGSTISDNTVGGTLTGGIGVGIGNSVTHNTVTGTSGYGIGVNDRNIVSNNDVSGNLGDGIKITGSDNLVDSNNASGNGPASGTAGSDGNGIENVGARNTISNNTVGHNSFYGIYSTGNQGVIAGNHSAGDYVVNGCSEILVVAASGFGTLVKDNAVENTTAGTCTPGLIYLSGTNITAYRNDARSGTAANDYFVCPICDIAPRTSAAAMTSPVGNVAE